MNNTGKKIVRKENLLIAACALCLVGVIGLGAAGWYQIRNENEKIASISASVTAIALEQDTLQSKVATTQSTITDLASSTKTEISDEIAPLRTLIKNQPAPQESQDQLLTAAVAKATPAVVSIVVSEEAPDLQITYVNPFGNDPNFQNSGIEIPVYQEKGTSLQQVAAGTGFLISHDGYILTNKHVVADTGAEYTVLLSNGTQQTAQIVYRDPTNDIAIAKIDGTYPTIATLGDSSTLELGQTVIAIGNALGQYNNSVSVGDISGLNRTIQASDQSPDGTATTETLTGVIQTDAAINPGNSGGPLIDLNGNVVGINVATVVGSNNISFSIPIDTVKTIIQTKI